jgi:hypothetical protein
MKLVALFLSCLALSSVTAQAAERVEDKPASKVDVTGTWKVEVDVGGQAGTPVFTLKQEGDKLTGKYSGSFGEQDVTGNVAGDHVEWKFTIDQGDIIYKGTIDKDSMKGTTRYGDLDGTWSAKREAAKGTPPVADGKVATVEAILEKYVKAIGGKEAWNKVETRQMKADLEAGGDTSEWTLVAKAPNLRATRVELPGLGLIQDGFDGKTAWQKSNNGVTVKEGDDLARARIEADFRREIRLKDLYPDLASRGPETFNGEAVHVLESKPTATSKVRFSFSDKTGLLVRQESSGQAPDGNELGVETELSDYRDVGGVKYPHVQKNKILVRGQTFFGFDLKVKEIKHNEKIDDDAFAKPAN